MRASVVIKPPMNILGSRQGWLAGWPAVACDDVLLLLLFCPPQQPPSSGGRASSQIERLIGDRPPVSDLNSAHNYFITIFIFARKITDNG